MGLLPRAVKVEGGRTDFEGVDILNLSRRLQRDLRGRRIGMIFQEPLTALNPSMRIGDQIAEVFEAHGMLTPTQRRAKVLDLATEVDSPTRNGSWPHFRTSFLADRGSARSSRWRSHSSPRF